jgi:hypothetical protein
MTLWWAFLVIVMGRENFPGLGPNALTRKDANSRLEMIFNIVFQAKLLSYI